MKKTSFNYLLTWIIIVAVFGFGLGYYATRNASISSHLICGLIFTLFLLLIIMATLLIPVSRAFTRKTGKKINSMDFQVDATFNSSSGMYYIDAAHGQVAAATLLNPFQLQIINAKDLTDIKTGIVKGPLGGATQTYFCFKVGGTFCKISTFSTNGACSLESNAVLTGISKADQYVELLNAAKESALQAY